MQEGRENLDQFTVRHTKHSDPQFAQELGLRLGSALRTPIEAREDWGLAASVLDETAVVKLYQAEWARTENPEVAGLAQLVGTAASKAFKSDYSQIVRDGAARAISDILTERRDELLLRWREDGTPVTVVEIGAGAGASTRTLWQQLCGNADLENLLPAIQFKLIEPSSAATLAAKESLKDLPVEVHVGTDMQLTSVLKGLSPDILFGVASIHHHAEIPFDQYYEVLAPDGVAVFADWHNAAWMHPATVRETLEQLDWKDSAHKTDLLQDFANQYPRALEEAPRYNDKDQKAIEEIRAFWQSVIDLGAGDAIWMLEGHRPVELYRSAMSGAGFHNIDSAPLLADSSLLQVTVGHRVSDSNLGLELSEATLPPVKS